MSLGTFSDTRRDAAARRRRRRRGVALIALACLAVAAAGATVALDVLSSAGHRTRSGEHGTASPRFPRPPGRPPVGRIGAYQVASASLLVLDHSRPALGTRRLPVLVRYPVVPAAQASSGRLARRPFPLVVFAPGFLQCGSSYATLLRAWASAGYVVATVEFPRTHCHVAVPDEADLSSQPADISAVISRLLAAASNAPATPAPAVTSPGGALSGLIDPAKIAVAGHSDGGDTAAALAANTCCRDPRVKAALILSGAEWPPLGGRYFPPGTPPILFTQGTDDTWNPPAASTELYQSDTTGTRYFLTLLATGHFTPYEGHAPPEPLVARVTIAFLNAYLDGQPKQVAAMQAAGNVPGVAVLTANGHLPT